MNKKYYLDTSIWLDFFENRDEPNLSKGAFAQKLIEKIIKEDDIIIYADVISHELRSIGYDKYELENMFKPLTKILMFVESNKKQYGKGKDLSAKRKIPLIDAMHALISRDNKAILITRDKHFEKLLDITRPKKPENII